MFGTGAFGGPYFAQAFSFDGEIVVVLTRPDVLELLGVSSGPIALIASADGALRLVALSGEPLTLQGVD